jgi:hypothetical protein
MQPNKKILLKAVDAANSSVTSHSLSKKADANLSIADQKLIEIRSRRFNGTDGATELFTSHYKQSSSTTPVASKDKSLDLEEGRTKRLKNQQTTDKRKSIICKFDNVNSNLDI